MVKPRIFQLTASALAAVLVGVVFSVHQARTLPAAPSPESLSYVFSLEAGDPSANTQARPSDLLTLSGSILLPCEGLGLDCAPVISGALDDLNSLSYGWDFWPSETPSIQFSVGRGSIGQPGSAVRAEASCLAHPEPHGDVFHSALDGGNSQTLDGDGVACAVNTGYGLSILEGAVSDNLDSLERDSCRFPDLDCDSVSQGVVYFSLAPGSPTLTLIGASPADILVSGIDYAPMVWAAGAADLGLQSGDILDGLCLLEDGDGLWSNADQLLFSLAPGSPTLASTGFSAAALLRPGPKSGVSPLQIGLQNGDDLDAVLCEGPVPILDIYLPMISKP